MPKAIGQFTIYDFHDVYSSATAPSNPVKDMIWLDTSLNPPVMKVYNGSKWELVNDYSAEIEELEKVTTTHTTQINTQQGKIDTLIQDTTITKNGKTTKLKDEYNKTVDTVNEHTQTLSSHDSTLKDLDGSIISVDSKVNEVKKTLEGTISTVSETSSKVGELEETISIQDTSISQLKDSVALKVEKKDVEKAVSSAKLSRADFIARNFLTTPLIVSDSNLSIYTNSGIPNPPVGAVFNSYNQKDDVIKDSSVSSNGNAWAVIIGYEFYNNTTDEDKKASIKDKVKKVTDFMYSNISVGRFNSMDFKFIDTNYKFNKTSSSWGKSDYKEIYISTIWLQVKAMIYAYEILEDEKYLNLGLDILDSLLNTHFYINNKVKSGELPNFLEWASYEYLACDNLSSNKRFSASTKQFANQMGYYIHQAIKDVIRVVGDNERTTPKGDKYKPSDVLTGLKKYLKNAYETQKITASPLGLPYGYFHRITNTDGSYSYIPQNWDFINDTWGDSWFVGDVVTYTIYSFAASGLTDIAREYANSYYKLRIETTDSKWANRFSNSELLFYDRIDFNTGTHLSGDESVSITYTALFYEILKEIGLNEYIDSCCYTLAKHQINDLSNKNIDGSYPWDVSKDGASLEFKSLGEIINSEFYKNLNITSFSNIENNIEAVSKVANAAKTAIGDYTADGILDQAEKDSVKTYLLNLSSEKTSIDKEYLTLYATVDLTETAKTNLKTAYDNFVTKYNDLITKINTLLNATTITEVMRTDISNAFTAHDTYLATYSQRVNEAIAAISEKKKQDSITTSKNYYNSQIVLDKNSILSTVSKTYSTKTELDDLSSELEQTAESMELSIQELSADIYDVIENGDFTDSSTANWKTSNMSKTSPVTSSSKKWMRVYNTTTTITEEAICSYEFSLKRGVNYTFEAAVAKYSSSNAFYRVTVDGYNKNTGLWSTIKTWTGSAETTANPTLLTYSYTYSTSSGYSKFRIAVKRLTSDPVTNVYITDVSVTSSNSLAKKSQLKLLSDKIESKVESDDLGTLIQQNAYAVKIAWNNNSKYVQFENGGLAIYNGAVSESQKRAFFDEKGNHFWRDGYYLGKIGSNQYTGNTAIKGINFDLEYDGGYMTWAVKKSSSASTYTMMWTYANKTTGSYSLGKLHAGADIDMHNYYLRNVNFEGGGINGTLIFTQIVGMNSDGTATRWYNNSKLVFQNGILIDGTWGNV